MQKNVLLIESDTSFAHAMSAALESRGYGVRTSPDGKEGFELARALHPDCVVLCVELPGLSGYSWCNRLKKDGALKSIPLVITSSEATPETFDQHRKLKTRAEDYLLKPFQPETLVERVGALVGLPESPPEDEELVTLEDVELEGAPAQAAPAPSEEDVDLKMLDEAFDSISRGGDEPSAHAPGSPASDRPLTLMPEADESPALSEFDREMAAALADLAEEAAQASKVPPPVHPAAPDPFRAPAPPPPPPPPRSVAARVEPIAQEETSVLLEDVEVLSGVDEDAAAALLRAQEEAASLRSEVSGLKEAGARIRQDADLLREETARLRVEAEEAQRLLAVRDSEAAGLQGKLETAADQSARAQEQLARAQEQLDRAQERSAEQEGELAAVLSKLSAAELSATERGAELVDAQRRTEDLEREIEVARTEAEGLRAEIESLRSSADGVRGEAAGLRNEVATLGATVDGLRNEIGALRGEAEIVRAEADGLRAEGESLRAEASGLRAELMALRADAEARGAEAAALRSEAQGQRESAEAFRAEAEGRANELSRRIQDLEAQSAQLEDRVLRASLKIKSDEKLREKTRKALSMVLQILEERPGGGDGSGPPAP